jgi:hypothetical protein
MNNRVWYVLGALLVAAVLFQVFFRYDYIHVDSARIVRVDRLTQASCDMPCLPPPTAPPYDAVDSYYRLDDAFSKRNEDAVSIAKATERGQALLVNYGAGEKYTWTTRFDPEVSEFDLLKKPVENGFDLSKGEYEILMTAASDKSPVLICYCNSKGWGWRWEVHVDTRRAYSVEDDADLSKKYGITPGTPSP